MICFLFVSFSQRLQIKDNNMTTFIEKMVMLAEDSIAENLEDFMLRLTAKYHPVLTRGIVKQSELGERTLDLNFNVDDFEEMSSTSKKLSAIQAFRMWFNDMLMEKPTFVPELAKDEEPYDYCSLKGLSLIRVDLSANNRGLIIHLDWNKK
jgi:hypothetical protein